MPFRKIDEEENTSQKICTDPEHFPPADVVLPAGKYVYVCPKCGKETFLRQLREYTLEGKSIHIFVDKK
jgi:predicted RNA-binding Zn-ribbon protein involved in translation (DUF1610 family)